MWVIEDVARPAGLFAGGEETAVLLAERVSPGATVAVTLERAGGVPAPPGDPLLPVVGGRSETVALQAGGCVAIRCWALATRFGRKR